MILPCHVLCCSWCAVPAISCAYSACLLQGEPLIPASVYSFCAIVLPGMQVHSTGWATSFWGCCRGICCAPVFSDTPQYNDWVSYHERMGVEGIHIYVAHVDDKHRDVWGRGRVGHSRVIAPPAMLTKYSRAKVTHEELHAGCTG